jgi:hypothetical protein
MLKKGSKLSPMEKKYLKAFLQVQKQSYIVVPRYHFILQLEIRNLFEQKAL